MTQEEVKAKTQPKVAELFTVLNFIRKETHCGLAEANNALLELIKVLKERPLPIMDKHYKLKIEWENK